MIALALFTFVSRNVETRQLAAQEAISAAVEVHLVTEKPEPIIYTDLSTHPSNQGIEKLGIHAVVIEGLRTHARKIVIAWLIGVVLLTIRLLGGGWVSFNLRRAGTRALPEEWQTRVNELVARMNIRHKVDVVTSTFATVPMVVGVFKPVVLIPISTLLGLSPDQLEAILIHELTHVRRYDNLVNRLQRIVETVFFFHPAVWWVSGRIRTEREHCCDDAAVESSNPKLYARALATLEELRAPLFAVAATDGSLLARVRRLVAPETATTGSERFTIVNVLSFIVVISLMAIVVDGTLAREADASEGDQNISVMVDVSPSLPHMGTTLASSLTPILQTAGRVEWSNARLQAVMGHAFHFAMKEGGESVMHDAIDWGLAMGAFPKLAEFRTFHANKKKAESGEVDLPALKREARDAVLTSLQNGVPALVWQPMSLEQKDSGTHAYCWGVAVGYDEADETYTIRHPFEADTYTVRYDAIGHADRVEWFYVAVYEGPSDREEIKVNLNALRHAVAFANGTRYTDKNFKYPSGNSAMPYGFAAYEIWKRAFDSENVPAKHGHHHAGILKARRQTAAVYLRDVVSLFPEAAEPLTTAAAHYDREAGTLTSLHTLCLTARDNGAFSADERTKAARLLGEALNHDRAAIAQIETALTIIDTEYRCTCELTEPAQNQAAAVH
jgi:beta-lactamase regulating signal transducer with metallopeptidase domain